MTSLTDLSLLEATAALRAGDVTSVELTHACNERIDAIESDVHAFLARTPELAMEQAAKKVEAPHRRQWASL
jgi:Asp-tRNA(Asn)/Glu-tRNA(Gln) amidotransferase A subunit family amidase